MLVLVLILALYIKVLVSVDRELLKLYILQEKLIDRGFALSVIYNTAKYTHIYMHAEIGNGGLETRGTVEPREKSN